MERGREKDRKKEGEKEGGREGKRETGREREGKREESFQQSRVHFPELFPAPTSVLACFCAASRAYPKADTRGP